MLEDSYETFPKFVRKIEKLTDPDAPFGKQAISPNQEPLVTLIEAAKILDEIYPGTTLSLLKSSSFEALLTWPYKATIIDTRPSVEEAILQQADHPKEIYFEDFITCKGTSEDFFQYLFRGFRSREIDNTDSNGFKGELDEILARINLRNLPWEGPLPEHIQQRNYSQRFVLWPPESKKLD